MSRHLVTCLPEEDLSIGSCQTPPQVPSLAETGAILNFAGDGIRGSGILKKTLVKSVILCLIGSLCIQNPVSTSSSDGIDQPASPSTKVIKWWDARSYKGNSRVETQWIIHLSHSCFTFLLYKTCINSFVRRRYLTRTSASCTQNAYFQAIQKSIQIYFQLNVPIVFLFLFCFAKNVQGSICDICIDNNLLAHKYLHTKQRN